MNVLNLLKPFTISFTKCFQWTGYKKTMLKYEDINWNKFVSLGLQLIGKPYVFGSEVNLKDPDPMHIKALDCSELIEWLFSQISLYMPDGSYNQIKYTRRVDSPDIKIGDLGFKANPENGVVHHVGVYIGSGKVLEAKGKAWGTVLTNSKDYESSLHFLCWGRHFDIEPA